MGSTLIEDCNGRALNDFLTLIEQNPENQLTGPTVEDELARNCRLMGKKGKEIQDTVSKILKDIKLGNSREWFIDEVSTGERRRVALGLALLGSPKLLLLDEPFADLDDEGAKSIINIIKKYRKKGISILITSKQLDILYKISDRIGVISQGNLLMVNKPDIIIRNSKTLQDANLSVPPISALCLEIESAGALSFDKCPVEVEEAKELFLSAFNQ